MTLASSTVPRQDDRTGDVGRERVLDYPVDRLSMDQAIERCRSFLSDDPRPRLLMPINAAILTMARRSQPLRQVIQESDLVLADGASIVLASRLVGGRLAERVTGVDLMERLILEADRQGHRVFFFGARPEIVERVAERVRKDHPGAVVAGYRDGYFSPEEGESIARQIQESGADIVFVALPSPLKEVWCAEHLETMGASIVLPVGGAFDVYSGAIRRAPVWMQRVGMEWSWRLLMEPRSKWRRYLETNTLFLALCIDSLFRRSLASANWRSLVSMTD